ncbi:hypothetical protein METBIDRAFT_29542 [Metschnikowia bicuspidata var. bicuspidata NRRL YB-4993]|uniref:Uncharacterized protein n=1 Tax=Metschnikowia bicuspidata var. bicuspidata NRRL YB-4993 TaxID=869754 RepID=A0A1A0HG65_9ASCO|nr:hypothetical protein METBIDRAFT_29542 [Metschnikowia bicuspidata var. bicuspidata NRRL YB-4993]OBA22996.1 hypothetical protein METBIDRAFT_29542 [Metschnikowia bicuspidata var. bicuspidata NRRL YB-4993]
MKLNRTAVVVLSVVLHLVLAMATKKHTLKINHNLAITNEDFVDWGELTISDGAYFAIVDSRLVSFDGSFVNNGRFYVKNTGISDVVVKLKVMNFEIPEISSSTPY